MNPDKYIAILGGGESGTGAAILAKKKGFRVFLSDKGLIKEGYKKILIENRIEFEEGEHTESKILAADEIIKSPGIPEKVDLIEKVKSKGIKIIDEIEFAGRYVKGKKICITGSNGKTTTALLTYHILRKAGLDVALAGNIGKSLAMVAVEREYDYYVIELSSFQLDGMYEFKADVAILLNITPDHLDRYDYKIDNYAAAKLRITQNQTNEDAFIYCADDKITMETVSNNKISAQKYPLTLYSEVSQGGYVSETQVHIKTPKNPITMSIYDLALQGKHNLYNSMAAAVPASLFGIRKEIVRESLSDFRNAEHRLEHVLNVHGIEFINDSKATNVNSVWYALESMNKPVVLILGGVDKGNDYSIIDELVVKKVKAIVCMGLDNKKILKAFKGKVEQIVVTASAREAVATAYYVASLGDVVLLSPACASFDLFQNYEDRGRQFKDAVRNL